MEDPIPQTTGNKKGVRMNWIVAVIAIVLIIWMIYTASQMAKVKPDNSLMPGMNAPVQATITMSADMSGMNR